MTLSEMKRSPLNRIYWEIWILLSICMFMFRGSTLSQDLAGKISIYLTSDKDTFVRGEMIFLEDTVENLTNETLIIPEPTTRAFLDIRLVDADNRPIYGGMIIDHISPPMVTLSRREKKVGPVSLTLKANGPKSTLTAGDLIPGEYKVWVELKDVKSNVVTFRVIDPQGQDQIVLDNLAEQFQRWKPPDVRIPVLENLIQMYPTSVYMPNVYWELITVLWKSADLQNADKLARISLEFVERYPNFIGLYVPVNYYRTGLERKLSIGRHQAPDARQASFIENELQQIRSKYPMMRVGRYVENEIQKARVEWSEQE